MDPDSPGLEYGTDDGPKRTMITGRKPLKLRITSGMGTLYITETQTIDMKHEMMHRAYRPTIGGKAVPASKLINDLGKDAIHYIGTFAEYNPIGMVEADGNCLTAVVRKEVCTIRAQNEFSLPGFKLEVGLSYHGSDFNNNGAMEFTKQDLLRIAHAMDEDDCLIIAAPDSLDESRFVRDVLNVTRV